MFFVPTFCVTLKNNPYYSWDFKKHLLKCKDYFSDWREGNISADWLANFSILMDFLDFHILENPPSELQSLLFDDIYGACMPRNVCLIS